MSCDPQLGVWELALLPTLLDVHRDRKDYRDREPRTGSPGQGNQGREPRAGSPGQEHQDKEHRTGNPGQAAPGRQPRTGIPGQGAQGREPRNGAHDVRLFYHTDRELALMCQAI